MPEPSTIDVVEYINKLEPHTVSVHDLFRRLLFVFGPMLTEAERLELVTVIEKAAAPE